MFEAQLAQEQKEEEGSDGGKRHRNHNRHSGRSYHRHHERDADNRFAEPHTHAHTRLLRAVPLALFTDGNTHTRDARSC